MNRSMADGQDSQTEMLDTIAILNKKQLPVHPWEEVAPDLIEVTNDGLKASRKTSLRLYFRPLCQYTVEVETHLTTNGEDAFLCTLGGYHFSLGGDNSPGASLTLDRWSIAVTGQYRLMPGKHRIRCCRGDGVVSFSLDGQIVLETKDPRGTEPIPDMEFFFRAGVIIHEVTVKGKSATLKGIPLKKNKSYNLSMCIDFFDDMIPAPWTERTLQETLEIYKRNHIKRVYFIDHVGYKSGFWDHYCDTYPVEKHARQTFENIGDFLPTFTQAAHREGLEVHAVFKPQEGGFSSTYPHGSEKAGQFGKISRLGGMAWRGMDFVARHPDLRLERDMRPVPPDLDRRIIDKIVLSAEKGLKPGFDPRRIRLWVSADNGGYAPYIGPMDIKTDGEGIIIVERLVIKEKFMALTVEGDPTCAFGNTLRKLITVYDQAGQKLPITYANMTQPQNLKLEQTGFVCDYPRDTVGEMDTYYWLDSGKPLGIAKGWERFLCGVLCEAYPEVQDWWMDSIDYYIRAGVDGVDIRDLVHARTFDWDVFGFNPPLVEAFKKKHGIDILNEPFERKDLRRLRGEYYTEFLRRARQRLKTAGKQMHLHVGSRMKSPEWHTELDVYQDWESWLRAGLADEITLKMSWLTGEVAAKSFNVAHELGLPINYCPYINRVPQNPNAKAIINYYAQQALDIGMDGFVIYENAALMKARADGRMEVMHPWALDTLKQHAWR